MDVRTLCLGVLSLGDASGYEIKKRLEDVFSHFYDASFGSIYPALSRLQTEGLVQCEHEQQAKRPDKKVYSLTTDGRLALVRELNGQPGRDRVRSEFLVAMCFADLLPAAHVAQLIDRRIDEHQRSVTDLAERERRGTPAHRFVSGYGRALYEAAAKYLEENRYLVESEALLAQVDNDRAGAAD
ncbi:MAG: helix-turn-helix transcriptional regulator [Alphaproteobacteria bacterium]|jgi:DNA-binding PadR family transcriptional regulator|nr:helix-turn-helix transcriptional regulator [Alphaproteobacteria bacterium]MDP6565465.1 helix-turn-helix transcriptional regulator [Alphaproteobacteria bacterium]MDP6815376.1 helix-turn-helix transcriptional regulator [Alphaproteobacteria bacterium]